MNYTISDEAGVVHTHLELKKECASYLLLSERKYIEMGYRTIRRNSSVLTMIKGVQIFHLFVDKKGRKFDPYVDKSLREDSEYI
jgi:hypothetical protein